MFQGSFLYNYKSPYHIWEEETIIEKEFSKTEIKRLNALKEDNNKATQELKQQIKREAYYRRYSRRIGGKPAKWRHNKTNRAYVREKGYKGINWQRYQQTILIPLLILFAVKCIVKRLKTIIQEDKASLHAFRY